MEAEMIVPESVLDEWGQPVHASATFLRYRLVLERWQDFEAGGNRLRIVEETLEHINRRDAGRHLRFPHRAGTWRQSVVFSQRQAAYISTEVSGNETIIHLHQDGNGGRPHSYPAGILSRSVVSMVNPEEYPTAYMARREMQSWCLVQLEPSALRSPDPYPWPGGLDRQGRHLPATLLQLEGKGVAAFSDTGRVDLDAFSEFCSDWWPETGKIRLVREGEWLNVEVETACGTTFSIQNMAESTLRFIAMAALGNCSRYRGLLAVEHPETGQPADRLPKILNFLFNLAVDVTRACCRENPSRQLIITSHSPDVIRHLPDDCVLYMGTDRNTRGRGTSPVISVRWLTDTWRQVADPERSCLTRERTMNLLNPDMYHEVARVTDQRLCPDETGTVRDAQELQPVLPFVLDGEESEGTS